MYLVQLQRRLQQQIELDRILRYFHRPLAQEIQEHPSLCLDLRVGIPNRLRFKKLNFQLQSIFLNKFFVTFRKFRVRIFSSFHLKKNGVTLTK